MLVLLALSTIACANSKTTGNANNASLTPLTNEASERGKGNAPHLSFAEIIPSFKIFFIFF